MNAKKVAAVCRFVPRHASPYVRQRIFLSEGSR
jgi:hypothetical protein